MNPERWSQLALKEQMGHITSELRRAIVWEERADFESRQKALDRALELVQMTLSTVQSTRRREIARLKEVVCHCIARSHAYDVTLRDLEIYGLSHLGS